MKTIKIKIIIALTLLFQMTSCLDLNELNISPNSPVNVSSNYILTYVLTGSARSYSAYGDVASWVSGAMQFNQNGTNQGAGEVNQYLWPNTSWSGHYDYLRNIKIILNNNFTNWRKCNICICSSGSGKFQIKILFNGRYRNATITRYGNRTCTCEINSSGSK